MKRREFIKKSALVSSSLYMPSFIHAINGIAPMNLSGYKKLVIVQLSGGNDGLNTVIPFDNDIYHRARPVIGIKKNILKINDDIGFHENLQPLKRLYDNGYLSVINNVGYPNPNRSHFRSTDIWQTASHSNEYLQKGWIGRYLDHYAKHAYNAIEINDSLSVVMKGSHLSGVAVENPEIFYKASQDPYFKIVADYYQDEHLSEHNLGYLYKTMISAESSAKYIFETSKTYKSNSKYPYYQFAKQLKTIAQFINSGLDTKVFYATLGGFDTHANQLNSHKNLLKIYAESIESFVSDLKQNGTFKDTLILTFSEFGRRVEQNAARGTDHGAANNVFIIGEHLKTSGVYNKLDDLQKLDANGDIKYEIDFRSIYATVLKNWLEVDDTKILNMKFDSLNFI